LKYFSLSSVPYTWYYDNRIIPLLHRMINSEELKFFLSVAKLDSNFIDGVQIYDQILSYMTQLNKFTFDLNTTIINESFRIDMSSNEDIQRSFIGRGYGQVGSYVHTQSKKTKSFSHISSEILFVSTILFKVVCFVKFDVWHTFF
jgi:hypothetical protein